MRFIGERLMSVTKPWDGDCEEDEMILHFESGDLHVYAFDQSEVGSLSWSPAIHFKEKMDGLKVIEAGQQARIKRLWVFTLGLVIYFAIVYWSMS